MSSRTFSFFSSLFVVLSLLDIQPLFSQALPTASKNTDISLFGGYSVVAPDYEPAHNKGLTMGVDYTRYIHRLPFAPSLEFRFGETTGPAVHEHDLLFGFKAQRDFGRFHPYGDFLAGIGGISYPGANGRSGYQPDSGRAFSMGAGVDFDITHRWQAKIDLQYQAWNLGTNSVQKPQGGDYTLSPVALTIGVSYRFPFHPYVGPRHPNYKNEPPPRAAPTPPPAPAQPPPAPANTAQPSDNTPPPTPPPSQP